MNHTPRSLEKVWHLLRRPQEIWPLFRSYLGLGKKLRLEPVTTSEELALFLESRASYIAQVSLYGYLRTRAGQRYPELFEDQGFVRSINTAKWQIWQACLGDITVYAGGLLARNLPDARDRIAPFMEGLIEQILDRTGTPEHAGPEFGDGLMALRRRIASCAWHGIGDDAGAFTESPTAVVKWAPIVDHLKALDEPIVLNSVRFKWQEVRSQLRQSLRYDELAAAMVAPTTRQ